MTILVESKIYILILCNKWLILKLDSKNNNLLDVGTLYIL